MIRADVSFIVLTIFSAISFKWNNINLPLPLIGIEKITCFYTCSYVLMDQNVPYITKEIMDISKKLDIMIKDYYCILAKREV